ncbi:MAG: hypothetical protein EXR76_05430 [Myxococcales bacterium]|nr:hypothetical protein [Myxococcales bacterium]
MARRSDRPRRAALHGLTLLEVLVVLGILVMLMGVGVAGIDRLGGVRLRNETNRLAAVIKYTFNRCTALGLHMRLSIDLETDAYHVEASETPFYLRKAGRFESADELEEEDRKAEAQEQAAQADGDSDDPKVISLRKAAQRRAKFVTDDLVPTVKMEGGTGIDSLYIAGREGALTSGTVYLHFFPSGWVEPAVLFTTDGEGSFQTLVVHPLTGKVSRKVGKVEPDRGFGEPERQEDEGR